MQSLKTTDIIALGFMTFALFLGAGNIIFPPLVGQGAGAHMWSAAAGFLLTGVGLPLATVVALARVGGGLDTLTQPIGRTAGVLLGVLVYLAIGPLFATPRTATVSFEVGLAPFVDSSSQSSVLFVYSLVYFGLVMLIALFPGKLIDTVGKYITPVLIIGLILMGAAAFLLPAGVVQPATGAYLDAALGQGFVQGYQTMDALGALVFGIVIVNAIRDRSVSDRGLQTRYAIIAAIIAAVGLALVYISLVYLGATSGSLAPGATTGVPILTHFVQHTFGTFGSVLLALVITLACLTTAVGLVCACGEYFSRILPVSYRTIVITFSLFSMVVANQGLEQLIAVSLPVLIGVYPVAITLVALSLMDHFWVRSSRVFKPTMLVAAICGVLDGAATAGFDLNLPTWFTELPGAALGLGWLTPVLLTWAIAAVADRVRA